ncbi:hypothetical protein A3L04_03150 [Thermococcus chitonophagus]|uniref:DUF835 domain-containing protein n=1 Tax=Thermococcus chitonophagus TaxID=54262 RepID=A0A170SZU1_9EURY|nr:DUF835 domain-containing protein [Thermococcus chitonophagus]ASJ16145.1 hypothetical protein A3L04_03150 [Thermococcus chitonophagus]CUX78886.1 hypothetical protein CHITON_2107 [Thermococcus chitonophagus]
MPDALGLLKVLTELGAVIISSLWLYLMIKHRRALPYSIGKLGRILIWGLILIWIGFLVNFANEFVPKLTTSVTVIKLSKTMDDVFVILGASLVTYYLYQVFEKKIPNVEPMQISIDMKGAKLPPGAYLLSSKTPLQEVMRLLDGKNILAITRRPQDYEKLGIPYIWLTKTEGENTLYPTNLPRLLHTMVTHADGNTAFILDGLEYLILENGFESVMKFLSSARDYMLMKGSVLIALVGEKTLDEHQLAVLKRELKELEII